MYKKYCLKFESTKDSLFYLLCFAIYKMVDSEYSIDTYKSVKISIETVMRNLEMLKFVPDHLKTKKMFKYAVKKITLSFKICS